MPAPVVLALHLALVAPSSGSGSVPMIPPLGCSVCLIAAAEVPRESLLAQASLPEAEQRRRERERLLAVRVEELNLKLSQLDTGWPASSVAFAYLGAGLGPLGLISGAVLAGYGVATSVVAAGAVLLGLGFVGVVFIVAAMVTAIPRAEIALKERNRLLEEKMRADAELAYLRGKTGGPRP